jgi:hypothetical protein
VESGAGVGGKIMAENPFQGFTRNNSKPKKDYKNSSNKKDNYGECMVENGLLSFNKQRDSKKTVDGGSKKVKAISKNNTKLILDKNIFRNDQSSLLKAKFHEKFGFSPDDGEKINKAIECLFQGSNPNLPADKNLTQGGTIDFGARKSKGSVKRSLSRKNSNNYGDKKYTDNKSPHSSAKKLAKKVINSKIIERRTSCEFGYLNSEKLLGVYANSNDVQMKSLYQDYNLVSGELINLTSPYNNNYH